MRYTFNKLKWYILSSCFLTVPWFLCPCSTSCVYYLSVISHIQASGGFFHMPYVCSARVLRNWGKYGNESLGGRQNSFARVRAKLFWREIYCANPRPEPNSHSVSMSHMGLGRRYSHIIHEYDLATAILVRLLIQPRTCKMGSYIFSAMIQLKFASTTRASFLSMPST